MRACANCVAYRPPWWGAMNEKLERRAVLNLGHTTAHALERVLGRGSGARCRGRAGGAGGTARE